MGDVHEKNSTTGEWGVRSSTQTTDSSGNPAGNVLIGGGVVQFTPSTYSADLTMDGTAQSGAIATGVAKIQFGNLGDTTEAIRVAFGTTALEAEGNLNMTTDGAPERATTGYYIPAAADAGEQSIAVLGVPSDATHYAVANAVDSDTQTVTVNQGV